MDRHLSPAETAKRFGVSIKALRLYESRGLLTPLRTANGSTGAAWRAYGPDQIARLHQILALKRLGLPLARIGEILSGADRLEPVLALQERVLVQDSERVSRALSLVRAARAKLAAGQTLSIDDLMTLTTETTMTTKPTQQDMKELLQPFAAKHFTEEDRAILDRRPLSQAEIGRQWRILIEEAKALMAEGDPTSPAAQDLGRRWKALYAQFTGGNAQIERKVQAIWTDAMADPETAARLPVSQEIFAFVNAAIRSAKSP